MNADEIKGLQQRPVDGVCYSGPIDGTASNALAAGKKACPDQEPALRIETGMHVAQIIRASLTTFIRTADEKLADYMKRLDESDAVKDRAGANGDGSSGRDGKLAEKIAAIKGKRDRHKALLEDLERTGEDQFRSPIRTPAPWRA